MKNILITLLFSISVLNAKGQKEIKQHFEEVVEVQNKKDVLFKNAQTWIANTFGNYKSVVQFEDKEAGRIIIKGLTPEVPATQTLSYINSEFKMTIDVKENRFKVEYEVLNVFIGYSGDLGLDTKMQYDPNRSVFNDEEQEITKREEELKTAKGKKRTSIENSLHLDRLRLLQKKIFITSTNDSYKGMIESLKREMSKNSDW